MFVFLSSWRTLQIWDMISFIGCICFSERHSLHELSNNFSDLIFFLYNKKKQHDYLNQKWLIKNWLYV